MSQSLKTPKSIALPDFSKIRDIETKDFIRELLSVMDNTHRKIYEDIYSSLYVDRGDPAAWDFSLGDLTTDGTWRDLDLSSIIPVATGSVLLRVSIEDNAADNYIRFRKNGNAENYNVGIVRTQVANQLINADLIIHCDADRVVEYYASNTVFTTINILVKGWWK